MPVWHEATKAWRAQGRLQVVGITQEQHPERCRLFAQWTQLDWPILWDPFNLTGSHVVPRFLLIDEHGVVRSLRASPETIEAEFLDRRFEKPKAAGPVPLPPPERVVQLDDGRTGPEAAAWRAISRLLWSGGAARDALQPIAAVAEADPAMRFRLGVAHRMRHDGPRRQPGDFQAALDAWRSALRAAPRQYIWRRRIQQYGPRLDKPYPFYDWVQAATRAVSERGEKPVTLVAPLTRSERAGRGGADEGVRHTEPDPRGEIERGPDSVAMEWALAPDTRRDGTRVCVHLLLRAQAGAEIEWDLEAGVPVVWLGGQQVPAVDEGVDRGGGIRFEVELDAFEGPVSGYVLYYACLSKSGACRYLRHDFTVGRGPR